MGTSEHFSEWDRKAQADPLLRAARDLMHQAAFLSLDVALGRGRELMADRVALIESLLHTLKPQIALRDVPESHGEAEYWHRYYMARPTVCFKCPYRRDPDPQADLAYEAAQLCP